MTNTVPGSHAVPSATDERAGDSRAYPDRASIEASPAGLVSVASADSEADA